MGRQRLCHVGRYENSLGLRVGTLLTLGCRLKLVTQLNHRMFLRAVAEAIQATRVE